MKKIAFTLLFIVFHLFAFTQSNEAEETEPPDTVKIGSYIISVHDINFHNKEYTIRFWLWFLYDNIGFDFATQLDIPNAKSIEKPEAIMDMVEGKTWQLMKMKCTMKQNWNVQDFPFDKQHLVVKIENSIYDRSSLVFLPDTAGSTFDSHLTLDGWHITNFKVSANINEYQTVFGDPRAEEQRSEYASFNIEMDIERNAFGLFMKIFIGMYISFLISMLSFTPHPTELEPRFGLPVGGLFAAVGNKYIIDSLLPESSSFSLVDSLHTITFMAIFATLLVSAISLKLHDNGNKDMCNKVNYWGSRVVVILFVVLNLIFIGLAI
jgi:hypothetical protein